MRNLALTVVLVATVVVTLPANTGCSAESGTQEGSGNLRQVPLIIGRVFLPHVAEEGARGKPTERLDTATEYEGVGVGACLIGAKLAGWAAGYEFMPVHVLKKGEKPRDVMATVQTESDVFVLVRVSTRTADLGTGTAMIAVFGDAALYRRETMSPIASAGFTGVEKIDPKEIKGDKVHGEYWIKTVASLFARNFDEKFLAKMQTALDGKRILEEVAALQASAGGAIGSPTIEVLPGGDERDPELKISMAKAGLTAEAYLVLNDGKLCRKWLVGGAGEVHVVLKPGNYSLYVKTIPEKEASSHQVSQGKFKVEYKKRYTFSIQ